MVDLKQAVILYCEEASTAERKAVEMLKDEVAKRTRILLESTFQHPKDGRPLVVVASRENAPELAKPFIPLLPPLSEEPTSSEGYLVRVEKQPGGVPLVLALGNSPRAVLFAVGRLLRTLEMERDSLAVGEGVHISTQPRYPLRGHQLGYRPKTNAYDGWDLAIWEQYIRDLVAFGCNAVELIPPRSDDVPDSPLFPLPPMQMMEAMSRLLADYDLQVWVWYPAMDEDYSNEKTVASAIEEWGAVFSRLPRLDAIFVPGGDPGHTPPRVLMAFLEKQAQNLRRYHPQAQMWVSPQGFSASWMEEFLKILNGEPDWLTGIVFGPQVRTPLPRLRELVPKRYPIRLYPDITHSRQCQFPVPDWDAAFAFTEGRECINPRPLQMTQIARLLLPYSIGFITYSEGCNDDVNKAVWSAVGWDPNTEPIDILRDYSGYFVGKKHKEAFAQGLLALEKNWEGQLLTNSRVPVVLQQFQEMERLAPPRVRLNWRFQMALYRAYYDAYIQTRLRYEKCLEEKALEELRSARRIGSLAAVDRAEALLDQAVVHPVAPDWRARIFELAEALFQSIRMQLSVERYYAVGIERGANLDAVDFPLNNRIWLKAQFAQIRRLPNEGERTRKIEEILNWSNPGPGGFYDNFDSFAGLSCIVDRKRFEDDPEFRETPLIGFAHHPEGPISWQTHLESRYDAPLQIRYTGLDPNSEYRLRVVYGGDRVIKLRLTANELYEVHPFIEKPFPPTPLEFDIPKQATQGGTLTLTWFPEPGLGGNGRGCQVSELWLMRKEQ